LLQIAVAAFAAQLGCDGRKLVMKKTSITLCLAAVLPLAPAFAQAAVEDRPPCAINDAQFARCGATSPGLMPNLLAEMPGVPEGALRDTGKGAGEVSSSARGISTSHGVRSVCAVASPATILAVASSTPYTFTVVPAWERYASPAAMSPHADRRRERRALLQIQTQLVRHPGSYTLLLAGLGLLGIVAQRRLQNLI
jgi:hypothetical protein